MGSAERIVAARARAPRDAVTYSIVSSISSFRIRVLSSRGTLGRSYSSRVYFVAYAPVELDGQVGIVVVH